SAEPALRSLPDAAPVSALLGAAGRALLPFIVIVAVLVGGGAFASSGLVTPFMLPKFSAVLERVLNDAASGELALNTGLTLYRALTGFVVAAVAGIVLGMAMSRSIGVNWFFDPIISVGFPMPKIAFLPVIILWLGFYDLSKISIVIFEAVFPV